MKITSGIAIYALTLATEFISVAARFVFVWLISKFVVPAIDLLTEIILLAFHKLPDAYKAPGNLNSLRAISNAQFFVWAVGIVFVLYPVVVSLLVFFRSDSGYIRSRLTLEARDVSEREANRIREALKQLQQDAPREVRVPSAYYVISYPVPLAFSLGTTLYFTNALLRSPFLLPVIAHELGHQNCLDSRLNLALRSLTLGVKELIPGIIGESAAKSVLTSAMRGNLTGIVLGGSTLAVSTLATLSRGGIGLRICRDLWANYWRERDYIADQFVADCSYASGLIEYLEKYEFSQVAVPFFIPAEAPTEFRINRLQARLDESFTISSETMLALPQKTSSTTSIQSVQQGKQSAAPLGIPTARGEKQALQAFLGIVVVIVLLFVGFFLYNLYGNSIKGDWYLTKYCNAASCPENSGVRVWEDDLVGFVDDKELGDAFVMLRYLSTNGKMDGVPQEVRSGYVKSGENIHVQSSEGSLPLLLSNEFTAERNGDELILTSSSRKCYFMSGDKHRRLLSSLTGKWLSQKTGNTLEFDGSSMVSRNGISDEHFSLLSEEAIQIDAIGATSPHIVHYTVSGKTLTIAYPNDEEVEYTKVD